MINQSQLARKIPGSSERNFIRIREWRKSGQIRGKKDGVNWTYDHVAVRKALSLARREGTKPSKRRRARPPKGAKKR